MNPYLHFHPQNPILGIWKLTSIVIVIYCFIGSCVMCNFGGEKFAEMENLG